MQIIIQSDADHKCECECCIIDEKFNVVLKQNEELKKQNEELKKQNEERPAVKSYKFISIDDYAECYKLCRENKPDELKVYIDEYRDVALKNDSGLLSIAAREGHLDCIKLLFAGGADVHANNDKAFYVAVAFGHLECVKFLIEHGADVHAENDSAICGASRNGHVQCVKLLIENHADVHAQDDDAIRSASRNGHVPCVKFLIDNGADIHAQDDYAIRYAAWNNNSDVVEFLAKSGANVLAKDSEILRDIIIYRTLDVIHTKKIIKTYLKYGDAKALSVAKQYIEQAFKENNYKLVSIFGECGVVFESK